MAKFQQDATLLLAAVGGAAFGSRGRQGEYQRGHALRDADAFCLG